MEATERAIELVNLATSKFNAGKDEEGILTLRQAVSLAPENAIVKEAFGRFSSGSSASVVQLCQSYVQDKDVEAGEQALARLTGSSLSISDEIATDCFRILLLSHGLLSGVGFATRTDSTTRDDHLYDQLLSTLLRSYHGPKVYLALELDKDCAETFDTFYSVGDATAHETLSVLLNSKIWPSNELRQRVGKECFQRLLAKTQGKSSLEGVKQQDYEYAKCVKEASRLLSAEAELLMAKVDISVLDTFLLALDSRIESGVSGTVTVALARYFDVAKEPGHELFKSWIQEHISRLDYRKDSAVNDLIIVLSASASVFPLIPAVAASMFLTKNFVSDLMILIRKVDDDVVNRSALQLFSAACIESSCRQAILQHCRDWLRHVLHSGTRDASPAAATILAMLHTPSQGSTSPATEDNGEELSNVEIFKTLRNSVLASDGTSFERSAEGLAYISLDSAMKEKIIHDKALLNRVLKPANEKATLSPFGALTLLDNISRYLPTLTEEQKRISELKAYANASKPAGQPKIQDRDEAVARRCTMLLAAGTVPYLSKVCKGTAVKASPASLGLVSNILLSLSRDSKNRGTMAQQGSIPILLECFKQLAASPNARMPQRVPAHALSRILISVDPKLVFGSRPPSSAIGPILSLLQDDDIASDGPRDMLPLFEGLLALTNLVSDPSFGTISEVMRSAFPRIEELLLDNNALIQRAAAELICNLMASSEGLEKFADGSRDAARRLRILVALTDVDDVATRRGASGALAMITEFEGACKSIVEQEKGVKILLDLCGDEDGGCKHRGVVCLRNLILAEGSAGKKAREKVKGLGGVEVLKKVLQGSREQGVLETAVEALKAVLE